MKISISLIRIAVFPIFTERKVSNWNYKPIWYIYPVGQVFEEVIFTGKSSQKILSMSSQHIQTTLNKKIHFTDSKREFFVVLCFDSRSMLVILKEIPWPFLIRGNIFFRLNSLLLRCIVFAHLFLSLICLSLVTLGLEQMTNFWLMMNRATQCQSCLKM